MSESTFVRWFGRFLIAFGVFCVGFTAYGIVVGDGTAVFVGVCASLTGFINAWSMRQFGRAA